jgi:4,5-DOPA dioxygenase extradiol
MNNDDRYPVLFIGHGSPMNIVANNAYTFSLAKIRNILPVPEAILVISAHWLTNGTSITSGRHPEQIYDFGGFPKELYEIKYSAPGSPEVAEKVCSNFKDQLIKCDNKRGIDHAAWAVLKHIYPEQKIPVLEMSLDIRKDPEYHFKLGKMLSFLRDEKILVIGSGNMVHNLSEIDFNELSTPFGWAIDFDRSVKNALERKEFKALINYHDFLENAAKAVPFNDHYLPMLYILGMINETEQIRFTHESIQNASISMRSFIVGSAS